MAYRRVLLSLAIFVVAAACEPASDTGGTSQVIGVSGGIVEGANRVTVSVPAGAVSSNVSIGVSVADSGDSSARAWKALPTVVDPLANTLTVQVTSFSFFQPGTADEEEEDGVDEAGDAYEITPHGQTFDAPVTITILYDDEDVPADGQEEDLVVFHADPVSSPTCEQDCSSRECGPDPVCGESCGNCPAGQVCRDGQCAVSDMPEIDWVTIPGGTFQMGSTDGTASETPVHPVTVATFEIARTEVTQGQWEKLMGSNPSFFSDCGANCPVEMVNWYEAVAFCNALSDAAGLSRCYTLSGDDVALLEGCVGYRLPTEAEWEYAARSGGQDITYPWGDAEANCDYAVMDDCRTPTQPVCSKSPAGDTSHGLCDMAGNVAEWVWDWFDSSYPSEAQSDPQGPGTGSERVLRGGDKGDAARLLRTTFRVRLAPLHLGSVLGFRPARWANSRNP